MASLGKSFRIFVDYTSITGDSLSAGAQFKDEEVDVFEEEEDDGEEEDEEVSAGVRENKLVSFVTGADTSISRLTIQFRKLPSFDWTDLPLQRPSSFQPHSYGR